MPGTLWTGRYNAAHHAPVRQACAPRRHGGTRRDAGAGCSGSRARTGRAGSPRGLRSLPLSRRRCPDAVRVELRPDRRQRRRIPRHPLGAVRRRERRARDFRRPRARLRLHHVVHQPRRRMERARLGTAAPLLRRRSRSAGRDGSQRPLRRQAAAVRGAVRPRAVRVHWRPRAPAAAAVCQATAHHDRTSRRVLQPGVSAVRRGSRRLVVDRPRRRVGGGPDVGATGHASAHVCLDDHACRYPRAPRPADARRQHDANPRGARDSRRAGRRNRPHHSAALPAHEGTSSITCGCARIGTARASRRSTRRSAASLDPAWAKPTCGRCPWA